MRLLPAFFLTLLLWAGIFLPGLGTPELKGEEGRRILPARQMLRSGNFILPYSEGRPYHRKPPGINWAIAASFAVSGVQNEWSSRLPSVLGVLALSLTALWAGQKLLGEGGGLALAITCLTSLGMLEKARLAEIESLYVSLAGMGFFLWAVHWSRERSPWLTWLSAAVPFALAHLVKGPVFLAFFYPVAISILAKARRMKDLFHPAHLVSLALGLAPMIVWGILVKQQMAGLGPISVMDDDGVVTTAKAPEDVWWQQIAGRLTFAGIDWGSWLQLPFRSLLLFAPWAAVALVLVLCRRGPAFSPTSGRQSALFSGLGLGILLGAGLFCALPTTRSRYLFPLLAPVSLWAVVVIRNTLRDVRSQERLWHFWRWTVNSLASTLIAAALVLPFVLLKENRGLAVGLNVAAASVLILWLILAWKRRLPEPFFTSVAGAAAFATILLVTTLYPWGRTKDNVRSVAEQINALASKPGSIAAINPGPQPFLFYLGPRCAEASKITDFPEDVEYLLITPEDWAREDFRGKLEWRNFKLLLTKVKDARAADGKEFLLIGRP